MCKGKAFDDSSMEEKERAIESELDGRGLNNPDNNFGRRSDNSELLGSVISDEDYWQDLIDSKRVQKERGRSLIARTNVNIFAQKQKTLEKRQSKQNADEIERKMAAMEKAHEVAIRTLRKTSRKA